MTLNNKPSILICSSEIDFPETWQQVLLGIEEEGIPYQIRHDDEPQINHRAYRAAQASALAVGIACSSQELIVHHRNLPEQQPLFRAQLTPTPPPSQLRELGSNAARLVKGIPFKNTLYQQGE
ncbi:glycerol dehydratase reactivase beta/small subunit family protein [Agarivorans sp. QJM3NY_29]|uniref:glycerol dehydratase reactivase beta/small subunit family protein n=1 Tax=unclassified Agarivorans TaxID=2636026 RepID=UPI003D7D68EE